MKRLAAGLFVLCALATAVFYFYFVGGGKEPKVPPAATPSNLKTDKTNLTSAPPPVTNPVVLKIPAAVATVPIRSNSPLATNQAALQPVVPQGVGSPATVLENMRTVIRNYGSRFGGNPVGTNPEITRALDGENPGQVKFIPEDSGLRINDKGELIDPWGTPFFFHQLSAREMEIRSAGPDRKMWTGDDLVVH